MSQALYLLPFITLPFIAFYCVAGTKYQHEPSGPSIQRLWNEAANTLAFLMKPNWFEMQQTDRVSACVLKKQNCCLQTEFSKCVKV